MQDPLNIGDSVVIMGKRKGTVRYIGATAFGPGEWVGVELEKPTGTHDGCVNGQVFTFSPHIVKSYRMIFVTFESDDFVISTNMLTKFPIQRYFTCKPNYGVYVQRQGVSSVNSTSVGTKFDLSVTEHISDHVPLTMQCAFFFLGGC